MNRFLERGRSRSGLRLLGLALLVLVSFLIGFLLRGGDDVEPRQAALEETHEETRWTCSMHPQIVMPEPGQCPICGMDLIPLEGPAGGEELGPRTLKLSEAAAALAEIQVVPVRRQGAGAGGAAGAEIRLVGQITYDETRNRTIAAWVAGRLEKLHVDFTGTEVRAGAPMVTIYSPELYAVQAELLSAAGAQQALERGGGGGVVGRTGAATVEAARERLRLLGLSSEQIAAIESGESASERLVISAPVGGVVIEKQAQEGMYVQTGDPLYTIADLRRLWVEMEAYESDLGGLRVGQTATFTVEAVPGRRFEGRVVFIDPVLDARTRTVGVRLEAENREGLLKPGMFVHATLTAAAPGGAGRAAAGAAGKAPAGEPPLLIPTSAPLVTGERAVVYVRLPGEEPVFEGREIGLGPRLGDEYVVLGGLEEGELVVVNGNFKLDSELQIQARPSMMSPGGGGPVPGHDHGDAPATPSRAPAAAPAAPSTAPPEFRAQLGRVLAAYLDLQSALAADDAPAARAAAGLAAAALDEVDMALVEGQAHDRWMAQLGPMRRSLATMTSAREIEGLRGEPLQALSRALWDALETFGHDGPRTVRLFHCPMALQNRGADWLQLGRRTANPYYGASMLTCGSQTDSLPPAPGGPAPGAPGQGPGGHGGHP